ncbi:MAG: hypothetical protein RBR18_16530 [Desulfovibrionaceae bacterium]|nr:hypothetical protein [Desulfovibrionaceae bacterium]
MKATCPHCGTYGPVESFLTDDDAKRAVVAVGKLPGELPRLVWAYLGLHRKPGAGRALTWERVGRIVAELARLVAETEIQWKGQRVVQNRPEFWAQGITAMLDRDAQGKLERPLDGHNYLRAVAYEIAEKAWHQGNVAREDAARHRPAPVRQSPPVIASDQRERGNPGKAWVATGRSVTTQSLASRNDGEEAAARTTETTTHEYQPVPMSEALKGWRERINGDPQ